MSETKECWRCGRQRYIYESCHHCGGSCKPFMKRKQRNGYAGKDTEWWSTQTDMCQRCGDDAIGIADGEPLCQLHASTRNVPEVDE